MLFDGFVKYDLTDGTSEEYGYPAGWYGGEPSFAPSTERARRGRRLPADVRRRGGDRALGAVRGARADARDGRAGRDPAAGADRLPHALGRPRRPEGGERRAATALTDAVERTPTSSAGTRPTSRATGRARGSAGRHLRGGGARRDARRRRRAGPGRGRARRQLRRRALLRSGPPRRSPRRGRPGVRRPADRRATRRPARRAAIALLAAMADIEAGRYDCALVVGVEQMRTGHARSRSGYSARRPGCRARPRASSSRGRSCSASSATSTTAATGSSTSTWRSIAARCNFDERAAATRTRRRATGTFERGARFARDVELQPGDRRPHPKAGLLAGDRRRGRGGARVGAVRRALRPSSPASARGCRGSPAGATAPRRMALADKLADANGRRTSCRTCAARSPTRSSARGIDDVLGARRHRDPRLLHDDASTWRSTTSA